MELRLSEIEPMDIPEKVLDDYRLVLKVSISFESKERITFGEIRVSWYDDTADFFPYANYLFDDEILRQNFPDKESFMNFFRIVFELNDPRSYNEFVKWWKGQTQETISKRIKRSERNHGHY